jgi:hypothetical protein
LTSSRSTPEREDDMDEPRPIREDFENARAHELQVGDEVIRPGAGWEEQPFRTIESIEDPEDEPNVRILTLGAPPLESPLGNNRTRISRVGQWMYRKVYP